MKESSNEIFVQGVGVDAETRCVHWPSPLDIIAIKFKCCDEWYACYDCHREIADHKSTVWPRAEFNEKAVLCGACGVQLSVDDYLNCDSQCVSCGAHLNPRCAQHYELYFGT